MVNRQMLCMSLNELKGDGGSGTRNPVRQSPSGSSAPVCESKVKTPFGEFHFRRYLSDADPVAFDVFGPLVRIWQSKWGRGNPPGWRDFAMEDFVGWHRNLALSDFPAGAAEPRFRLFGSGLAEWMGIDLTGRPLSDGVPTADSDGIFQHLARVREEGLIGLVSGYVGLPGLEHRDLNVIELPLCDAQGEVNQLLHGLWSV